METKGWQFDSIGLERTRHVFLMVGIIDFRMSSAAWRGRLIFGKTLQPMHLSASGIQGKWLVMKIHWIMNDHPLDSW
jgi:hypothetical protein